MRGRCFVVLITAMLVIISCGEESMINSLTEPSSPSSPEENNKSASEAHLLNVPETYSFSRDGESTVSFSGQAERILMASELISAMKDFDNSSDYLIELYANQTADGGDANPYAEASLNESFKSVRSKTASSQDFFSANTTESTFIKSDFVSWISAQVNEVFPNQDVLAEAGVAGQIADGSSARYISAKGLEYDQAVNKGLIGALMVDQMLNNYLSISVLDGGENRARNDADQLAEGKTYTTMEHKWDEAYGYLWGVSDDISDPLPTLGEDKFLNKYLARVDEDPDFAGIAQNVFVALKLGRAAIVAKDYTVRDEQANVVRNLISQVVAIRAVYYLQQGKRALESGNFGGGFHDLSEGFGFIYSLRFTRRPNSSDPYFSKDEVGGFIASLEEGNGFWDVSSETLDRISDAISAKFDFTTAMAASPN